MVYGARKIDLFHTPRLSRCAVGGHKFCPACATPSGVVSGDSMMASERCEVAAAVEVMTMSDADAEIQVSNSTSALWHRAGDRRASDHRWQCW